MKTIKVQYYSDVLCVWAYVGQARLEELCKQHHDQIEMDYHFIDVFGDTPGRTIPRWSERGGLAGYGQHVIEVVKGFSHVEVHPEVWTRNVPNSSLSCHEFLYAVHEVGEIGMLAKAAWILREAFFVRAQDVSSRTLQFEIAEQLGLSTAQIEKHLCSGLASARLSRDLRLAHEQGITVSPTLVFNEGRQVLRGNVGYRVIEANIHELLEGHDDKHSWC